jgi:hypothetical protein
MRVPKHHVGKEVRITWRDPISTVERFELDKAPKGTAALATWVERGVIDDITEGVVRFRMSEAYSEGVLDEATFGWVPEDLIEKCEIMVASGET